MAAGRLTTAEAASILYVKPDIMRRAIWRAPNLFPRTLKFKGRWSLAASDIHGIINALDWEGDDREEMAANAFWVNLLTGGIPNMDFWLDEHLHLDMDILHRRVDYRSGCGCGQGIQDGVDVETERFNYLYEPGETTPVTPFSPEAMI